MKTMASLSLLSALLVNSGGWVLPKLGGGPNGAAVAPLPPAWTEPFRPSVRERHSLQEWPIPDTRPLRRPRLSFAGSV